jgi:glycosyltransferase involved in cell wall biosynthesis
VISVVIPTYNEESTITRCLQSLASQDLPRQEFEIIVVDGNSSDKTRDIAAKFADRVMIQTSPKVGGARNDGIIAAHGSIVATTDADCICPPNWLSTIKGIFERDNPDRSASEKAAGKV